MIVQSNITKFEDLSNDELKISYRKLLRSVSRNQDEEAELDLAEVVELMRNRNIKIPRKINAPTNEISNNKNLVDFKRENGLVVPMVFGFGGFLLVFKFVELITTVI